MRGDCRSFHTNACSRPPLPKTRTFISQRKSRLGVKRECCQTAYLRVRRLGCLKILACNIPLTHSEYSPGLDKLAAARLTLDGAVLLTTVKAEIEGRLIT